MEVGLHPEGEVPAWADRARGGGRRASSPRSDSGIAGLNFKGVTAILRQVPSAWI